MLLLLLAGLGLGACQQTIEPPKRVSDPVNVFVVDYGRHASLALPKEGTGLVEWSWGDWNWFALERTGPDRDSRSLKLAVTPPPDTFAPSASSHRASS